MGITTIILLLLVCLFSMFVYGLILFVQKKWKRAVVFLSPPVLAGITIIVAFVYFSHTTNPASLNLSIQAKKDHTYQLSGKWNERIDYYSFDTDFVAICTKDNQKVKMLEYTKGDWKPNYYNFGSDIPYQIKQKFSLPEGCEPQLFDIKVQKDFSMTFEVEQEPITLYYVHVNEEPMGSAEYWVKRIEYK